MTITPVAFLLLLSIFSPVLSQCPCFCRSINAPNTETNIPRVCARPRFANRGCVVSECRQDNPRRTPGLQCCTPPPTPSPTPSPSPSASPAPCPCICRPRGGFRTERAMRECERPRFLGRCEVTTCTRLNGRRGIGCCEIKEPMESPEPVFCPCTCRTGLMALMRAENECEKYPEECMVMDCMRREGGAVGKECCNGEMVM